MLPYYRLLLITLLCLSAQLSAAQNYLEYHTNIEQAEKAIFVDRKIKEGLQLYVNTLEQYDFVFVCDCVVAMQIALLDSNEQAFLTICNKAMYNGLLPKHLLKLPYIRKHPMYIKNKDTLISMYRIGRPHYLKRIDTSALQQMYALYAYDQMEKNGPVKEADIRNPNIYKKQITKTWSDLAQLIRTKGWPSDKTIGINQQDFMHELKTGTPELIEYYYKFKNDYRISKGQLSFEDYRFHSTLFFAIMAHYTNRYPDHRFFPDEFYIEQIKQGYLHPGDLCYVLDFEHRNDGREILTKRAKDGWYFGSGVVGRYGICDTSYMAPFEYINKARARYYMGPVETDLAKWNFMLEYKMFFVFGYDACRM